MVAPLRVLLVIVCGLVIASDYTAAFTVAPKFVLDLDKAPRDRWVGAVQAVVNEHGWNASFGPVFDFYLELWSRAPAWVPAQLHDVVQDRYPSMYQEIESICDDFAAVGHPELNITVIAPFFYFYEAAHMGIFYGPTNGSSSSSSQQTASWSSWLGKSCCGILTLPTEPEAPIIHGRNMDEAPIPGRNATLDITVTKNGGIVQWHIYDFTWFAGGFGTSSKHGALTLEHNWRDTGDGMYNLTHVMGLVMDNATVPAMYAQRVLLERGASFDEAVEFWNTTQFAAPLFAIMTGTMRRGAVMSVYSGPTLPVFDFISDATLAATGQWFMVQTNFDPWKPDPPFDHRRTTAERALAELGRANGATGLGVWMALSTWPVHNDHTMYSVLMTTEAYPGLPAPSNSGNQSLGAAPFGVVRVPMEPMA